MSDVSKKILDKIKKEDVKPIPKWQFVFGHILLWTLVIFAIIIGSFAMSILFRDLSGIEWGHLSKLDRHGIPGIIIALPYIWFITLAVVVYVSYVFFSKTKQGYKVNPVIIILSSILISFILGFILFANRTSDQFERLLRDNIPPYKQLQQVREGAWNSPEKGILIGKVIDVKKDKLLMLNDITGKKWEVNIENVNFKKMGIPKVGSQIIVVGKQTGDDTFHSVDIKIRREFVPR